MEIQLEVKAVALFATEGGMGCNKRRAVLSEVEPGQRPAEHIDAGFRSRLPPIR